MPLMRCSLPSFTFNSLSWLLCSRPSNRPNKTTLEWTSIVSFSKGHNRRRDPTWSINSLRGSPRPWTCRCCWPSSHVVSTSRSLPTQSSFSVVTSSQAFKTAMTGSMLAHHSLVVLSPGMHLSLKARTCNRQVLDSTRGRISSKWTVFHDPPDLQMLQW